MPNPTDIRSQLELYLRKELDPTRMSEVKHYIDTDPLWSSTYQALQTESQGIRLSTLHDLQAQLRALEASTQKIENNGHTPGDLSTSPTSTLEQNDTEHLERIEATPVHLLDTPPDPRMLQGIRYTTLHDELKKLQSTEQQQGGGGDIKKNGPAGSGGKVVGMRRWWWAVAAGVVVMVFYLGYYQPKQRQDALYAKYFVPYEYSGEFRSEPGLQLTAHDSLVKQGIAWYVHGEYGKAVKCFEKVDIEKENEEVKIVYLYSLIGNAKFKNAVKSLFILQDSSDINKLKNLITILK